ncbi:Enamine deaminase RidA, house cleaning of reactive enamine intermediates, YjgF/YER057c/UK114 family [Cohaesibacter marisflavi]|uniref:Enamine deaminase RidA, house cleaning of reactive enamine intermediates, YjgF/YER057c/UK114 family n=1 Tax=Cohaesibacter marisflavi TaxID=655353 RepID=A0A1I4ZFF1_9HYPH|nr:RidA family protein [Cohaesibacter marisflavi]SFN48994.1 Enamine deaminase RidA, house cleaning of reactive enamine intermediates, YjgF/YER057c/UK114 family [Cohaesibacter marisflavi]
MTRPTTDAPIPQGNYLAAKRHGDLVFTSGMTPRKAGVLQLEGPVKAQEPIESYKDAVILACSNALVAARNQLAGGEAVAAILSMTVFIAAEEGFAAHSKLADFASAYLAETLGPQGIGSRAAVGVATLPGNAPVEIQLVVAIG